MKKVIQLIIQFRVKFSTLGHKILKLRKKSLNIYLGLDNFSAYFGLFILDLELEERAKNMNLYFEKFCLKFNKNLYIQTLKINVS